MIVSFLLACGVSVLVSSLICQWVVAHGERLRILDDPKKHSHPKVVHTATVPRGGGLPIFGAIFIGTVFLLPKSIWTLGIFLGSLMLAITGYFDDRYEETISPYTRLFVNVLAALCVIGAGIGIAYISSPGGGVIRLDTWQYCFALWGTGHCVWIFSDLFALAWLVWTQNIVGWSSGVDGQLPGFVVVAATILGILALRLADTNQFLVVSLSGIVAGAYLGFLIWNWYPQKLIPGYGGKSLAGYLLGVLAILSGAKIGTLVMVLGIPFVDAIFVILKRIKERRLPIWGGREHFHHYLLDFGWSKQKIAGFYMSVSAILGILALQLNSTSKYFTMAVVLLVLGAFLIWLHHFSTFLKQRDQDSG